MIIDGGRRLIKKKIANNIFIISYFDIDFPKTIDRTQPVEIDQN